MNYEFANYESETNLKASIDYVEKTVKLNPINNMKK